MIDYLKGFETVCLWENVMDPINRLIMRSQGICSDSSVYIHSFHSGRSPYTPIRFSVSPYQSDEASKPAFCFNKCL